MTANPDYDSVDIQVEDLNVESVSVSKQIARLPVYWVTRGRTNGELDAHLQVWCVKPELLRCNDGDVMWLAPIELVDMQSTLLGDWSLGEAYQHINNAIPQSERECICVGKVPTSAEEYLVS